MNLNLKRLTRKQIALIIIFIIEGVAAASIWSIYFASYDPQTQINDTSRNYVFTPKVDIGCSRIVWEDTEVQLSASTNLKAPLFSWSTENKTIGTDRTLVYAFKPGKNTIFLKAEEGNYSVRDSAQILVVNSTEKLSADVVAGSMSNERVFITRYNGIEYYIDGVTVTLDGKSRGTIPQCRKLSVPGLSAGSHTWKAVYHGKDIGSGSFVLETVTGMKISRIDIARSYRAGETVDGKIFLRNTGTVPVRKYSVRTLVVNHDYEWMGDIAKKESSSDFDHELRPGADLEIPVRVKIPEKVSGIRPTGDYSVTVQLIINGKMEDTRTVKTVVV